jgi:hypothetical protein
LRLRCCGVMVCISRRFSAPDVYVFSHLTVSSNIYRIPLP